MFLELAARLYVDHRMKLPGARHSFERVLTAVLKRDPGPDDEILDAIKLLARTEGIFTEPAGGAEVAATKKLIESGRIPRDESIVISITGNGYKALEAIGPSIEKPYGIGSALEEFDALYARLDKSATLPAAKR
jgi:threonine synthase